jgi:hypothetical protein
LAGFFFSGVFSGFSAFSGSAFFSFAMFLSPY